MKRAFLRNPKGSRDWLPEEVLKQEFVRKSLVKVFELWGYQPIQTPILINWDTLTQGSKKLSDIAFKLIGQQGDLLALRADITTPIARVTAERLKNEKMPLRFYYVGKVFRYHARKTTNERELYQIGTELIGAREGASDLECIKVLIESLNKLGLRKYLISISHSDLWNELFKFFGSIATELYQSLAKKDFISFKSIISKSRLSSAEKIFWNELIKIKGNKESIAHLKRFNKLKKRLSRVLGYFERINNLFSDTVQIDLSLTSDVDYYTGIYFEVITPYLGRNLGSGGRYDQLINKFGLDLPATGFSLCLEDLLLALETQGKLFENIKSPRFFSSGGNIKKTLDAISKLHKKNKSATLKL